MRPFVHREDITNLHAFPLRDHSWEWGHDDHTDLVTGCDMLT